MNLRVILDKFLILFHGQHFGFNFHEDSSAYIKGWLSQSETKNKQGFGKENLDRVMNNARWLINEISGRL